MSLDLVPFGFTPTESLAYAGLVSRGPTSAYELSKTLGVARANTYQALNGLVLKGAAVLVSRDPQLFKPINPVALLALISSRVATDIDKLEEQIRTLDQAGTPSTVEFEGRRALSELVLRTAVRATTVTCVAPAESLSSLTPIWRKREVDAAETDLWVVKQHGREEEKLPFHIVGRVEEERVVDLFGSSAIIAVTPEAAILGRFSDTGHLLGYWSCDPLWLGSAHGAVMSLTT
jgi:sugar-specific transcriptional regulator TrmB